MGMDKATASADRDQDRDKRLSEGPQTFRLQEQVARLRRDEEYREHGKSSIILSRKEQLRVVLSSLQRQKEMEPHHTDGPFSLEVLEGSVQLQWGDNETCTVREGELLTFPGRIEHSVLALETCAFLLTLYQGTQPAVNIPH